jgi:hypothetical protein
MPSVQERNHSWKGGTTFGMEIITARWTLPLRLDIVKKKMPQCGKKFCWKNARQILVAI